MKRVPVLDRILARLEVSAAGCWTWNGWRSADGYGRISEGRTGRHLIHRWLWEFYNGPVPEGLELDHLCRNRSCCNPDHLEPVTRTENARRGAKYRPAECAQGHPYEPANVLMRPTGHITCRECNRLRCRARYLRRSADGELA